MASSQYARTIGVDKTSPIHQLVLDLVANEVDVNLPAESHQDKALYRWHNLEIEHHIVQSPEMSQLSNRLHTNISTHTRDSLSSDLQ